MTVSFSYGQITAFRLVLGTLLLMKLQITNAFRDQQDQVLIPVVFHIIYSNELENISEEQVISQLVSLNMDYNAENEDLVNVVESFRDKISATGINFVMSNEIENLTISPIQRVETSVPVFGNNEIFSSQTGGADPIQPDKILNIWVGNLAEGLLGFYGSHGVAIDFESFGTVGRVKEPYNLGRTLTHELGHFFSLKHLWGTDGCSSDDDINDTPLQEGAISNCNLESFSCGSLDMTQNFMNTSSDECLLFFSPGQTAKMRLFIQESLSNLTYKESDLVLSVVNKVGISDPYPNPNSSGKFYFASGDALNVSVFSPLGENLGTYNITTKTLDLSHLSKGIYLLKMTDRKGSHVEKIVIK